MTRTRSLLLDAKAYLGQEVVDLRLCRTHIEQRVDEPRGTDNLLDDLPGVPLLVVGGRRRDEDGLRQQSLEFVEAQRPVVQRRGQAEAVVDEIFLARAVALVHAADLRNRDVALVDDHQRARRQVVDQRRWRLAGRRPDRCRE